MPLADCCLKILKNRMYRQNSFPKQRVFHQDLQTLSCPIKITESSPVLKVSPLPGHRSWPVVRSRLWKKSCVSMNFTDITRFLAQMGIGGLLFENVSKNIEMLAAKVMPLLKE